jgi:hypothetical protein
MGTMSHVAGKFALSYDMYDNSAKSFLMANDSVMYFYANNAMALESAELGLHDKTLTLIDEILQKCTYLPVRAKTYETKAILYLNAEQYDSVLYSVNQLQAYGNHEPTGYVKKAQAFWYMANYDSALVYAKQVMDMPNASPRDQYNMLYILTYNDSTIDSEQIRQLSEERSDVDRYIIDPWLTQLSQATQLLEQDLNRKPNLTWLWATLATLCIIATSISIYIRKKKAKRQLISQQVEALQQTRDSLSAQTRQIENEQKLRQEKMLAEIELFCSAITEDNINEELCCKDFDKMCTIINQRMYGLVDKLKSRGVIAEPEVRLCVLVAIGKFNNLTMASLVPYGYDSFKTVKSSIATRLGLSGRKMRDSMLKLALGE